MNANTLALSLIVLFLLLVIGFALYERRRTGGRNLRDIPAFSRLIRAIGLAVEDGTRLHISLGHGQVQGASSAAGFAGLAILERIARTASISDYPPVATSGDGALSLLTRDTLASAYREMEAGDLFEPTQARLSGITPFSYAAGALPIIQDEQVSANILTGHFGPEIALITEASERSGGFTLAGTDNLPAQAVLVATAQEPLLGEELYAGGAYLRAGAVHTASLRVQDIFRWLIIAAILGGGILKFMGGLVP
jgi:hypothetical protein